MNGQPLWFLGLECTHEKRYFQLRLYKPQLSQFGHCLREFLVVTGTLALMSVVTVASIVWVAITVAEANNTSHPYAFKGARVSLPESQKFNRHALSDDDFYTLNKSPYEDSMAYADAR